MRHLDPNTAAALGLVYGLLCAGAATAIGAGYAEWSGVAVWCGLLSLHYFALARKDKP